MITLPDKHFTEFIGEHHILTLAVVRDNEPWCATCYYAYLPDTNQFVFTSDPQTRHISDMAETNHFRVAGTIALETRLVGKIRGIQFSGTVIQPDNETLKQARKTYLRRFPVARLMPALHLWYLVPDMMKLTDNRLGFGKKLFWYANPPEMQAR
jgi:uncharacterized protein YhbP (UPF0306 family)